jgi:hypothetical protein
LVTSIDLGNSCGRDRLLSTVSYVEYQSLYLFDRAIQVATE